jgi:dihydrofolate synthase/folylpolyglutamate synthase
VSDPVPPALLARLAALHPRLIDLSLDRLRALLAKLGNPEASLPPVLHVAGTNGKGSTCAFLRAMAEAAGLRAHVFTSPHLVNFNERIRLAGTLIDDATLAALLDEVEQTNAGAPITVFEVITAAALLAFARVPADLVILEVGLGGRGDATNIIPRPAACAITAISRDHTELLGDTIALIAAEKAGIIKHAVPIITGAQTPEALAVLRETAQARAAPLLSRNEAWTITQGRYQDATLTLDLPPLGLPGPHQWDNAGIAIATLRATTLPIPPAALSTGAASATWPGRMQRLHGALAALLPPQSELYLDGGHNEGGAAAIAEVLSSWTDRPIHLLIGMKQSKDPAAFLRPLLPYAATIHAIAEPAQHQALPIETIIEASNGTAIPGPDLRTALAHLPRTPARVLICGSLHLAGAALALDGVVPE